VTVEIDGHALTADQVVRVARAGERVALAGPAVETMRRSRRIVEDRLGARDVVYGLTTGVGERKSVLLEPGEIDEFNRLMILNHRVGQGPHAPADVVRAAMVRLLNLFASGTTGVRPELAQLIEATLNEGAAPEVRLLGSVGLADLAPLADLAHGVVGPSTLELAPGEALAFVDNNTFSTGAATLAIWDLGRLLDTLDVAGAMDLEAFRANPSALHPSVAESRPYPGLRYSIERLHALLEGSALWEEGTARNLQDPLSFRSLPQQHGAMRDGLAWAGVQLEIELNAAQGNPLVDISTGAVRSVGNFEMLPLAAALDHLRILLATVLTSAGERVLKLVHERFSDLPHGLAAGRGLAEDALNEFGVSVQALVAEARLLGAPVSFELASTTQADGIEDRMTMAPLGARRLSEMVGLGHRIAAIELLTSAQAVDRSGLRPLGAGTHDAYDLVRRHARSLDAGEPVVQDLEPLVQELTDGALAQKGVM
jgi:histidine ammonia-lyase